MSAVEILAEYSENNKKQYMLKTMKKKFYRDFSETDLAIISDLQNHMKDSYIQFPPFVLKRMVERGIIPKDIELFDSDGGILKENLQKINSIKEYSFVKSLIQIAMPFEFSNEGVMNPYSPYRMVWAGEFNGDTYFLKTALPPQKNIVRVIDVWKKQGNIPIHPLASQREFFTRGEEWSIYDLIDDMVFRIEEEEALNDKPKDD